MFSDPADYPELAAGELPDVSPPMFTDSTLSIKSSHKMSVGQDLKLTCEASGKPQPEVAWYRNQAEFIQNSPSSSSGRGSTKATLVINSLIAADAGTFTCVAKNKIGKTSRNFSLSVVESGIESPLLPSGPENTTVELGNVAKLECEIKSTTPPSVKWLKRLEAWEYDQKDSIAVGEEKFRVIKHDDNLVVGKDHFVNQLIIQDVTQADAGMYFCFVTNSRGYKFKNAYLTVLSKYRSLVSLRDWIIVSRMFSVCLSSSFSESPTENAYMESDPLFIIVICLTLFVVILLIGIAAFVIRKRRRDHRTESPDVQENLMRQHHQQQHQIKQVHPGGGLYQPAPTQQQQQPPHLQSQYSGVNNNQRPNGAIINLHVNKMEAPLPPPPPPSLHDDNSVNSKWGGYPHINVTGGDTTSSSTTKPSGSSYNGSNVYGQQQQNQYEVPHIVHGNGGSVIGVRGQNAPVGNRYPANVYGSQVQQPIYPYRSQQYGEYYDH